MTAADALRLHADDSVAVALRDLAPGVPARWRGAGAEGEITPAEAAPFGHKISLTAIRAGDPVRKYGAVIGLARADIPAGAHVHVHNLVSARARSAP